MQKQFLFIMFIMINLLLNGCSSSSSDSSKVTSTVSIASQEYNVSIVDDAIMGAKVSAPECTDYKDNGKGNYTLIGCSMKPSTIEALGGIIDLNNNQQADINETAQTAPLKLRVKQSGLENGFTVSPLTTLASSEDTDLDALANALGITKEQLFNAENTQLQQAVNILLISARNAGIVKYDTFLKDLQSKITQSSKKGVEAIADAHQYMKNNQAKYREEFGVAFGGFISDTTGLDTTNTKQSLVSIAKQNSVTTGKIKLAGFVYDKVIANATVNIFDGNTSIATGITDTFGRYSIELDQAILETDKVLKIEAVLEKTKLVSYITTKEIKEGLIAQKLSSANEVSLIVSNVTTAKSVLIEKTNPQALKDPEKLQQTKTKIEITYPTELLQISAAIQDVVDNNKTIEQNDTLAFAHSMVDHNQTTQIINITTPSNIEINTSSIVEDPMLYVQLNNNIENTEASLNYRNAIENKKLYSLKYFGSNLEYEYNLLKSNGTHEYKSYEKQPNGTWSEVDSKITGKDTIISWSQDNSILFVSGEWQPFKETLLSVETITIHNTPVHVYRTKYETIGEPTQLYFDNFIKNANHNGEINFTSLNDTNKTLTINYDEGGSTFSQKYVLYDNGTYTIAGDPSTLYKYKTVEYFNKSYIIFKDGQTRDGGGRIFYLDFTNQKVYERDFHDIGFSEVDISYDNEEVVKLWKNLNHNAFNLLNTMMEENVYQQQFNASFTYYQATQNTIYNFIKTIILQNNPPVFETALEPSLSLKTNDTYTFVCSATDPENQGDIHYEWIIDNAIEAENTTGKFTYTFNDAGIFHVECKATDTDGKFTTSKTIVTVTNNTTNTDVQQSVSALLTPATTADVYDAKNLVTQIREASDSFIDLSNDMNGSTIVGSQYSALVNNITPKVDSITSDLNSSVASFDVCLSSFVTDVESDFNTTINSLTTRLDAIDTLLREHDTNETWEDNTQAGDSIKHSYNKSGTIVTEVFSLNDMNVTAVYEEDENKDGDVESVNAHGLIRLNGNNYDVNITTLSFDGTDANFTMNGTIEGDNDAVMNLKELSIHFKAGDIQNPYDYFTNIAITADGTITTEGRTLQGKLTLDDNDQLNNKLVGSMSCLANEPNFEGSVNINMPLSALKTIAKDDDNKVNDNGWLSDSILLEAVFEDGSKSFIIRYNTRSEYDISTSTFYRYYTIQTQADTNVSCVATDNRNNTIVTHTFECDDNVKITPYVTYNNIVTLHVNSQEMKVSSVWWYNDDSLYSLNMHIDDEGDVKYNEDNGTLLLHGQEFIVDDINVTKATDFTDYNFDINIQGKLTDGDKVIAAHIGLANVLNTTQAQLYAQDLNITDGSDTLRAYKLSYGMYSHDMKAYLENDGFKGNDSWMHDSNLDVDWVYRYFTSSTYNLENAHISSDTEDYITAATVENLHLQLTDTDNETLVVDANISYLNDLNETYDVSFDGNYQYKNTNFQGHIDGKGFFLNDILTLDANIDGSITANGYEPFSLVSDVTVDANELTANTLLSRGEDPVYQLGIALSGNLDSNITVRLGDSNGIIGTYTLQNDTDEVLEFSFTDKDGNTLANVGESTTGNSWEIQYSDNSSETLY